MTDRTDRDAQVEALLRRALGTPTEAAAGNLTPACLDAETMAAWMDGGLSGESLQMAEVHLADCVRCQALLGAMAKTESAGAIRPAPARSWRWLGWMVPVAAAAAAILIVVWVNQPPPQQERIKVLDQARRLPAPTAQEADAKATNELSELRARRDKDEDAAKRAGARDQRENQPRNVEEFSKSKKDQKPAKAEAAAPPAAAAERKLGRLESNAVLVDAFKLVEVQSPDATSRWRIKAALVERSTDGGVTWTAVPTGIDVELTAASAPASSVCWLAGRASAVLLSTDGRTWRRLPFPVVTDLSAIQATDAKTATVTTADGRTFVTTDGGRWVPVATA